MADANGRPAELNDVISSYRNNGMSWYTWEKYDEKGNKIPNKDRMQYKYLKVIDGGEKPSEEVLNKMLTDAQAKFDTDKTNLENNKASGITKLKNLGLTDAEIKAIMRVE